MDIFGSLTSFFYNIVPGFLFLLINSVFFPSLQKIIFSAEHGTIGVIAILIVSMFLGFLFQSFTKIIRDFVMDDMILRKIEENDEDLLDQVIDEFKDVKELKNIKNNRLKIIYTIHNYLFSKYEMKMMPEFIMPRLALWSNMFFVFLWTIVIIALVSSLGIIPKSIFSFMPFDILLLIIFMFLALKTYWSYHYAYYDSLLRTFITDRLLIVKKTKVTPRRRSNGQ